MPVCQKMGDHCDMHCAICSGQNSLNTSIATILPRKTKSYFEKWIWSTDPGRIPDLFRHTSDPGPLKKSSNILSSMSKMIAFEF